MFTTLPLELFVCREVGSRTINIRKSCHLSLCRSSSNISLRTKPSTRNAICFSPPRSSSRPCLVRICASRSTLLLLKQPCLPTVSLITCDLGVMLEITGGVSATALAYIFPAACYIKLLPASTHWISRAKLPAFVCATFGLVVMILSLAIAMGKAWTPEGSAKICV